MASERLYKPGEFNPLVEALVSYFLVVCEQSPERARDNAMIFYHLKIQPQPHLFQTAEIEQNWSCSFWPDDEKDNRVFPGSSNKC